MFGWCLLAIALDSDAWRPPENLIDVDYQAWFDAVPEVEFTLAGFIKTVRYVEFCFIQATRPFKTILRVMLTSLLACR